MRRLPTIRHVNPPPPDPLPRTDACMRAPFEKISCINLQFIIGPGDHIRPVPPKCEDSRLYYV